ncbi:unnamed protein product [Closterium sp. NIES-54]
MTAITDFATTRQLDYAARVVAAPPTRPPSTGGESALGCDVLEDRQFELEFLAAASPHPCAMLLALEGDPDTLDIPTPCSYAEVVSGPWASRWRAAMGAEMASYISTGTYVDEVPSPGANVVDGMWIFKVKRPPGYPPVFKAYYVAIGFSQRKRVGFFQSPTPKMTTLQVLLHVAVQKDYELLSLDFSTAFLQDRLHEEIWLRRPPGFTGAFSPETQWSLRRPVYGLCQAPQERQCTDLGQLHRNLGLQITRDRAARTITPTQSQGVQQVLPWFVASFLHCTTYSSCCCPFPDKPFEPSGPYAELVGCLMSTQTWSVAQSSAEAEIYTRAMAAQELCWLTFLLTDLGANGELARGREAGEQGGVAGGGVGTHEPANPTLPTSTTLSPTTVDPLRAFSIEKFMGEDYEHRSFRMRLMYTQYKPLDMVEGKEKMSEEVELK